MRAYLTSIMHFVIEKDRPGKAAHLSTTAVCISSVAVIMKGAKTSHSSLKFLPTDAFCSTGIQCTGMLMNKCWLASSLFSHGIGGTLLIACSIYAFFFFSSCVHRFAVSITCSSSRPPVNPHTLSRSVTRPVSLYALGQRSGKNAPN